MPQVAVPGLPLSMDDDMISDEMLEKRVEKYAKSKKDTPAPAKETKPADAQHFMGWIAGQRATKKGGEGSGNFDHAGRPGKVGGSADEGSGTPGKEGERTAGTEAGGGKGGKILESPDLQMSPRGIKNEFDKKHWEEMDVPTRMNEWKNLSIEERDRQANARQMIPANQRAMLAGLGERPNTGDVRADLGERVKQGKELLTQLGTDKITKVVTDADDIFARMGVKPEVRHKLGMEMADALISQEHEAMARQLGDHGIHHIQGNIDMALDILDKVPGEDSDRAKAAVYVACVFHDTGYMTEPSRAFMDEGHPRWSAEHYDENIRPIVAQAIGRRWAGQVTQIVATHAGTDIDWESDPVASAVRVADNAALFHREKLPPVFRYVEGTTQTLFDLYQKRISVDQARATVIEKINKSGHSAKVKAQLTKAAHEISGKTGDFTLGMLSGVMEGARWQDGHIQLDLRRTKKNDWLNQMLDLDQKQFGKLAKSYGVDPSGFTQTLEFTFRGAGGNPLLSARIIGEGAARKERRGYSILYGRR
jgi:hypothetical protein